MVEVWSSVSFRSWKVTKQHSRNHEFCCQKILQETVISLRLKVQAHLDYAAGQWSETHLQVQLLKPQRIPKKQNRDFRETWSKSDCQRMTLNKLLMLENSPMRVNESNSAKKGGAKFLHSDVKDSSPVIAKAWLEFLMPRVVQPGSGDNWFFTQGQVGLEPFVCLHFILTWVIFM